VLLLVDGVSKSFGADIVIEHASFRVKARQKVALVGRNGTGKTTLLRIVTGQCEPDSGRIHLARGAKIGYLRQENAVQGGRTVLEEAEAAQADRAVLRTRLVELERSMEGGASEDDLVEYALLHERFMDAEGYALESDVRTVLRRMGFADDEFDKPTNVLSGGEKTRLAIARLLLEEPDLLILDEPTNHLDLQATEWLERWIRAYHGAVLTVSHDRRFLENTVESVVELRNGTAKQYQGGFSQFLRIRADDEARLAETAKRQQAEIAKLDEYVRRFMNSQRAAQARGRLKQLKRLKGQMVALPEKERSMAAEFTPDKRSGDTVIACKGLRVGFRSESGETVLIDGLDWTVRWGERWAIVGDNGAGKSTLVRTCLGETDPLGGEVRVGSNVVLGYFHQDVAGLDLDTTPLEHLVWDCGADPGTARDLLGRFLFSGDDQLRPVKTLSGGEKNKLVLASLTVLRPNVLVLDEPTNHLDMDSREALARVLREYSGTLVLVSHDRWLLEQTTDHVLDVRRGGPVVYPGPFADYQPGASATEPRLPPIPVPSVPKTRPGLSPRELSKEIGRVERLIGQLEEQVAAQEAELQNVEARLARVSPTEDIVELTRLHQKLQEAVASSISAWEEQTVRLERLRALQGDSGRLPGVSFRPR
jgi:ATP-binding cassette subfamily F protein 3